MGKYLMVKGADFSKVAVTNSDPSTDWKLIVPKSEFSNDVFLDSASRNYSFNTTDQIFKGSAKYKQVQISIKYAQTAALNVHLVKVPAYAGADTPSDTSACALVKTLGVMSALQDIVVTQEFDLPTDLDSDSSYIVALEDVTGRIYLTLGKTALEEQGVTAFTVTKYDGGNDWYIEAYSENNKGCGTYIYSFFQEKFK